MSAIKPVLVVVAGPNGSGKTEITKILRLKYNWTEGLVEVNPDNIAQQEFGDGTIADVGVKSRLFGRTKKLIAKAGVLAFLRPVNFRLRCGLSCGSLSLR